MPSIILGRAPCPECGFAHAHVKLSDKPGAKSYRYCPECGAQYYARSNTQDADLRRKIVGLAVEAKERAQAPAASAEVPAELEEAGGAVAAPPVAAFRTVFGVRVPA